MVIRGLKQGQNIPPREPFKLAVIPQDDNNEKAHHEIRLAGNVRAWPAAEAEAIVAAARRERILSKPRRPISETNFSLRAWEARTAQQMRGDRESEAK